MYGKIHDPYKEPIEIILVRTPQTQLKHITPTKHMYDYFPTIFMTFNFPSLHFQHNQNYCFIKIFLDPGKFMEHYFHQQHDWKYAFILALTLKATPLT